MKREELAKIINAIIAIREQRYVDGKNYHEITTAFLSRQKKSLTDEDLRVIIISLENDVHIVSAVIKSIACSHEMAIELLEERLFPEILCQTALESFSDKDFSHTLLTVIRPRYPRRFHALLGFAQRKKIVNRSFFHENEAKDITPHEALQFLQSCSFAT